MLRCFIALALVTLGGPVAHATPTGDDWLKRVDTTSTVDSAHVLLDITVTDKKGNKSPRTLEIWQKGTEHRLIRMKAPARLAGVGLLVRPGDSLHLFLPAYPPARRVVGSKRSDAFMGTDFAMEDLSRMTWHERYDAEVIGTENDMTHLKLIPREDTGDAAVHLWIGPGDEAVVRSVEHIDSKGRLSRRLEMNDIRQVNGVPMAHHISVQDLLRGRSTEARIQTVQINQGVSAELFTVTALEQH